jgi:serine/threonine-protein kinase RsbW
VSDDSSRGVRRVTMARGADHRRPRGSFAPDTAPRKLRVSDGVSELAAVRQFVRDSVTAFGGSARVADDLVQAVDEATCNVLLHGYAGAPGEVEIEAALRNRRIEITLLDRGAEFDPTAAPAPDTTGPPSSTRPGGMGMGIHLLRTMTDEVRHHVRPDGGNELTLVRSIDEPPRED